MATKQEQELWEKLLAKIDACEAACKWVNEQLKTLSPEEMYNNCYNAFWLNFLYESLYIQVVISGKDFGEDFNGAMCLVLSRKNPANPFHEQISDLNKTFELAMNNYGYDSRDREDYEQEQSEIWEAGVNKMLFDGGFFKEHRVPFSVISPLIERLVT